MKCPRCNNENPENTRFCSQCGRELAGGPGPSLPATLAYETPTKGLDRGTTFAHRFEIIEEVGQGGMGTVYKAYDTKIKEIVALKLLKPEISADLEVIDRFRNELKLARKVAHRHVCRMYDLNEEGLSFYISMEYVPGEDLKSFIRRSGHLNEAKALGLARQIAEGLAEAHRLGVIHRDLKPHNIMIDRDGNAKIMDFGIARSLHAKGLTAAGLTIGTPEYMSPEQAEARALDRRSDIYSLGVILYEMVTGRVPFEGETPLSIALKHRTEPPRDPKQLNTQISTGFSQIILRCLEKNREDRYQDAEDLLADLDRIAQGLPASKPAITARRPITSREITVKFNLKKLVVPGLAVVAIVLAALIIIKFRPFRSEPAKKEGAPVVDAQGRVEPPPVLPQVENQTTSGGSVQVPRGKKAVSGLADAGKGWDLALPYLKQYAGSLEGKSAQEIETFLSSLQGKLPADSPVRGLLDNIRGEIQKGKDQDLAGNAEASRRSYTKSESEMRKLLTLVNEKEKADAAKKDMDSMKKKAEEAAQQKGSNLLGWIATEKEKDAAESYRKNDFTGARILYGILNRVYLLSLSGGNEDQCLAALGGLVKEARSGAEAAQAAARESWLYGRAKEDETAAADLAKDKAYPFAAERYILAAFLYEKAKEVALENAQAAQK